MKLDAKYEGSTPMPEDLSQKYTVEEYEAIEEAEGIKYEYIDGEIYAMSGGTRTHSRIAVNCTTSLDIQTRGKSCEVFNSDMKVKITDTKNVYPDFSVVCGDLEFADEKETKLVNPIFVAEVMSPSSVDYDSGTKANFYRSLPSVQVYLLLDQERPFAQVFTRHEAGWLLREYEGLDNVITLEAIGCNLEMREVYLDVFEE